MCVTCCCYSTCLFLIILNCCLFVVFACGLYVSLFRVVFFWGGMCWLFALMMFVTFVLCQCLFVLCVSRLSLSVDVLVCVLLFVFLFIASPRNNNTNTQQQHTQEQANANTRTPQTIQTKQYDCLLLAVVILLVMLKTISWCLFVLFACCLSVSLFCVLLLFLSGGCFGGCLCFSWLMLLFC